MFLQGIRRAALMMAVAFGLTGWCAASAWAVDFPARLSGGRVDGTVQAVTMAGVSVHNADGTFLVPPSLATFKIDGHHVDAGQIVPGVVVEVHYKTLRGTVLGRDGNIVLFQPVSPDRPIGIPMSLARRTDVFVYTEAAGVVRVPLDQAIASADRHGVIVLGTELPPGYSYGDGLQNGSSFYFGSPYYWGPGVTFFGWSHADDAHRSH